ARGRKLQEGLYAQWGGQPTTAMLRHSDNRINRHTKARIHDGLRAMGTSFVLPSEVQEEADPHAADMLYASAVDELRRRAKQAKIASVHRENVSYGFSRNLLALKPAGLSLSIFCLLLLGLSVWARNWGAPTPVRPLDAG